MTVQPLRKPYLPSNGTEGFAFYENWCAKCWRDAAVRPPREDYANGCGIIARALLFNIGDAGYPSEWVQDDNIGMEPRCTAFAPMTGPKPGRWAALKAWATRRERKARSFAGSLFLLLLSLTGCYTISPDLTPKQVAALFPEADRAQAAPAPVTLTWTNPSRVPFMESGHRVFCNGGGPASTDTLTLLRDARVYAVPRVLCSPWAAGVPGWPECWKPSPPILLGVFDAVGQEGKRMEVQVAPLLGVATYYVTTTRTMHYNESCASNMVTVER